MKSSHALHCSIFSRMRIVGGQQPEEYIFNTQEQGELSMYLSIEIINRERNIFIYIWNVCRMLSLFFLRDMLITDYLFIYHD